jgi:hypothetical protein
VLAKNKVRDLHDIGISLEILPVVPKGEKFDYSRFYAVRWPSSQARDE